MKNRPQTNPPQADSEKNGTPESNRHSPRDLTKPFADRMSRMLAGKSLDGPIIDPANPNLIMDRNS